MPDIIELGRRIKAKYPEYADMEDAVVGQKVKAKFPSEYSDFEDVQPQKPSLVEKPTETQELKQREAAPAKALLLKDLISAGAYDPEKNTVSGIDIAGKKELEQAKKDRLDRAFNAIFETRWHPNLGITEAQAQAAKALGFKRDESPEGQRIANEFLNLLDEKSAALRGKPPGMARKIGGAALGTVGAAIEVPAAGLAGLAIAPFDKQLAAEVARSGTSGFIPTIKGAMGLEHEYAPSTSEIITEKGRQAELPPALAAALGFGAQIIPETIVAEAAFRTPGAIRARQAAKIEKAKEAAKISAETEALKQAQASAKAAELQRIAEKKANLSAYREAITEESDRMAKELADRKMQELRFQISEELGERLVGATPAQKMRAAADFSNVPARIEALTGRRLLPATSEGLTGATEDISSAQRKLGEITRRQEVLITKEPVPAGQISRPLTGTVPAQASAEPPIVIAEEPRIQKLYAGLHPEVVGQTIGPAFERLPLSEQTIARRMGAAPSRAVSIASAKIPMYAGRLLKPVLDVIKKSALSSAAEEFMDKFSKMALEGDLPAGMKIPEEVKPVLNELRKGFGEGWTSAKRVFPKLGRIENYGGPDIPTLEAQSQLARGKGPIRDFLYEWAKKQDESLLRGAFKESALNEIRDKADLAEAFLEKLGNGEIDIRSPFFKHRALNLPTVMPDGTPVLETNALRLFKRWSDSVARSMATEEEFGGGKLETLLQEARKADPRMGARLLREQYANIQGTPFTDPIAQFMRGSHPASVAARSTARAIKTLQLSLSTPGQIIEGFVPTASLAGVKDFGKSFIELASDGGSAGVVARKTFRAAYDEVHGYRMDPTISGTIDRLSDHITKTALKGTGFRAANELITNHALAAANLSLEDASLMLKSLDPEKMKSAREYLKMFHFNDADITRITHSGLEELDRYRMMRQWAWLTNGTGGAVFSRRLMQHPLAREVLVYSSPVRFVGDTAIKAVQALKNGDAVPIVAFLGLGIPAAKAKNKLYDWAKDNFRRPEDGFDAIARSATEINILGMAGKWGYGFYRSAESAATKGGKGSLLEGTIHQLTPGTARFVDQFIKDAIKYGPTEAIRSDVPIAAFVSNLAGYEGHSLTKRIRVMDRYLDDVYSDIQDAYKSGDYNKAIKIMEEHPEVKERELIGRINSDLNKFENMKSYAKDKNMRQEIDQRQRQLARKFFELYEKSGLMK